jgi:hypothetical protein
MLEIINSARNQPDGPRCEACGAKTRLFGIEGHALVSGLGVLSYVCPACDTVRVEILSLPSAREQAAHPRKEATMPMIRLLANSAFDPEATELLGAAFDEAWRVLEAAGSRLADEAHAAATREILAKTVILLGKSGERDVTRLVRGALALLEANSRLSVQPDRLAASNSDPDSGGALLRV